VHMPDARVLPPEGGVETRVIEVVLEDFVEPMATSTGGAPAASCSTVRSRNSVPAVRPRPARRFHEVAGRGGLGKHHQVHGGSSFAICASTPPIFCRLAL